MDDLSIADVPSPCNGICRMDAGGLCLGCFRQMDEITIWAHASNDQKREIINRIRQRHDAAASVNASAEKPPSCDPKRERGT